MKGRRARHGISHTGQGIAELGVTRELARCGVEHARAASRRTDSRRAAAAFGAQCVDDGGRIGAHGRRQNGARRDRGEDSRAHMTSIPSLRRSGAWHAAHHTSEGQCPLLQRTKDEQRHFAFAR